MSIAGQLTGIVKIAQLRLRLQRGSVLNISEAAIILLFIVLLSYCPSSALHQPRKLISCNYDL